jgi:predicted TIM-barrel fold metal-dependent hydrolase
VAKQGFKVIDSDIHVVEPKELWLRYLEPEFLSDQSRRRILWDNCARLYNLRD